MKEKSNYKPYISGLKGLACLMVMFGHFIGLYKYAESFPVDSAVLDIFDKICNSRIGFVLDESYWVVLFFVVSGYLVANSKVSTLKDCISKSVIRFLRLGIPILCAYVIIYLVYKLIGFHTADTIGVFESSFIQKRYNGIYSLWDVVFSPIDVLILNNSSLNSPYWCLREMFLTSVLIYFLLWFKQKIKSENIFLVVFFALLLVGLFEFSVVYAGLIGMLIALLERNENKSFFKNPVFSFFVLALCFAMRGVPRDRLSPFFFAALIMLLPNCVVLKKLFSSKISKYFADISFGVYSFHWPVFCSVGMLIILSTYEAIGVCKACLVAMSACVIITFLISTIYYFCIERYIYKFLRRWSR